jgi:hypothetical protein
MRTSERANAIIQDILVNHLPRIKEGLEKGYVDENQILVVYDHAVRVRILQECAAPTSFHPLSGMPETQDEHVDALDRIESELAAQADEFEAHVPGRQPIKFKPTAHALAMATLIDDAAAKRRYSIANENIDVRAGKPVNDKPADPKIYNFTLNKTPVETVWPPMTGSHLRALLPEDKAGHAIFQEATGNDPDIEIADSDLVQVDGKDFYSVPPATFGVPTPLHVKEVKGKFVGKPKAVRGEREDAAMLDEANFHRRETELEKGLVGQVVDENRPNFHKAHVEKLECVCGGLIHDDPQFTGDVFLLCEHCKRVFVDEFELAQARRSEYATGQRCVDAIYFTTGTLAGGKHPIPMETEINLNGLISRIKARNGKFTLSYEEIVRMALNQKRDPLAFVTSPDADLPMLTCVYHHRVAFKDLPGERSGSLRRGKSVDCTPGMSITCMDTSNA